MFNLATLLEDSARRYPQKTALIFGSSRLTYAQLNGAANQVANGLKNLEVRQGDKVALSCPNLPFFVIIYYGILKAGATVVPLNILFKGREIAYHLHDCEAKVYFCFQGTPELPVGEAGFTGFNAVDACKHFIMITSSADPTSPVEGKNTLAMFMHGQPPEFPTVQTRPEESSVILYTSGTTGQPKGAELSHFNMYQNAAATCHLINATSKDIALVVLPLFHSFGQTCLMNALMYSGGASVLLPRFDPDAVLGLFEREKVSVFAGVPTMYWALLNHPDGHKFNLETIASNLRICVSGGSALPVEVLKAFEKKFNVPILEGYGLSETSPVASFNHLDRTRKPGSIGTPIWGVEMQVVDTRNRKVPIGEPGEIVIRGHNIMKGYYKRPEETKQVMRGDWFHTGDIGKMDDDGYFYIIDRSKDMIIRGGFNVYPREIEDVLMTHPAVSLAAVIGVPHESLGEEVKAFVILKAGAEVSESDLLIWSKQNMADFKYPRMIEFRTELPMTATGKILKKKLRIQHGESGTQ